MLSPNMHGLLHWFAAHEIVVAVAITACVALLLVACLECTNCPCREKDDLFNRHEV